MMTYIFLGELVMVFLLILRDKNGKSIFQAVAYLNFCFMTYATINYILALVTSIKNFDSRYPALCVVSCFILLLVWFVYQFLCRRFIKLNKIMKKIQQIVLKISSLMFVIWIGLYDFGFQFKFNLDFFELCFIAYVTEIALGVVLTTLAYRRDIFFQKLEQNGFVFDAAITFALFIVFIMSVGSHAQRIYMGVFLGLWFILLFYLSLITNKKYCLNFYEEKEVKFVNYKKNFIHLMPCIILFVIMVFCENSLEFYCANFNMMPFGIGSFYIDCIRISLGVIVGGCGVFAMLKTKYINKIITFIFSLDLAIYIQVMFLNRNLGQTDLVKINWLDYKGSMIIGIVIWGACIGGIFYLNKRNEKKMENVCKTVSIFLTTIQLISIGYLFVSVGGWSGNLNKESTEAYISGFYYLTEDGYYDISKKNVVVFILDTFSNDYMDVLLEHDQHALDDFHDFTYYSNYNGAYDGTALAVPYLLTGNKFDNTKSCLKATHDSFASEHTEKLYQALKNNGIDARLYTDVRTQSWIGVQNIKDYFSNIDYDENVKVEIQYDLIMEKMIRSVMYRISPYLLKPCFLIVSDDFLETVTGAQSNKSSYALQDNFVDTVSRDGLHCDDKNESLIIYHFEGMHAASNYSDDGIVDCAKESLNVVSTYMKKLKELNVYDDTTIIVLADHGIHETKNGIQAIFMIKEAGASKSQYTVSKAPIDGMDFLPTVLTNFNIGGKDYGTSIYDFQEDEERKRSVFVRKSVDSITVRTKRANTALGSSFNCLYQYDYIGDKEDLRKRDEEKPDKILPLVDFWW